VYSAIARDITIGLTRNGAGLLKTGGGMCSAAARRLK
jgi:hypothetical protein